MTHASHTRRILRLAAASLTAVAILSPAPTIAATLPRAVTYNGPTLDKLRVVVQVSIVVRGRKIINVKPTVSVRTARSRLINTQAIPVLRQEVLQAQISSGYPARPSPALRT